MLSGIFPSSSIVEARSIQAMGSPGSASTILRYSEAASSRRPSENARTPRRHRKYFPVFRSSSSSFRGSGNSGSRGTAFFEVQPCFFSVPRLPVRHGERVVNVCRFGLQRESLLKEFDGGFGIVPA